MKVIVIDAENSKLYEKEIKGDLDDLQEIIDGRVSAAHKLANGDILFIDSKSMLKGKEYGFSLYKGHQPIFFGNGIIVGIEEDEVNSDVKTSIHLIEPELRFLTLQGDLA